MMTQFIKGSTELKTQLIEFYNNDREWIKDNLSRKYPIFNYLDSARQTEIIRECFIKGFNNFKFPEDICHS